MAPASAAGRIGSPYVAAGLAFVTLAAACSTPDDELSAPPTATTVVLRSGERLTGSSPAVLVIERDRSYVLQVWSGDLSSSGTWNLAVSLSREQALSGAVSLPASASRETGTAALHDGNGVAATSGSVTLVYGRGAIDGTADVQPDSLAGKFWGQFGLSCWVPRSSLGNLAPPSTSGGDIEPDVEDTTLVTETCAPFKALRP